MASVLVTFTVNAGQGVTGYWISVDRNDVPLTSGSGQLQLARGSHMLIWWFTGSGGKKMSIQGKHGAKVVVEVKETVIPDGETVGAGVKRFEV